MDSFTEPFRKKLYQTFGEASGKLCWEEQHWVRRWRTFMTRIKFPFTIGYGMTECGPLISYEGFATTRKGSSGKILDIMELKIDSD